jgi:hypothetical protein
VMLGGASILAAAVALSWVPEEKAGEAKA